MFDASNDQVAVALDLYESRCDDIRRMLDHMYHIHDKYSKVYTRLTTLSAKTRHPTFIPFGSHAFIPGQIVSTSQFTAHIGDGYYKELTLPQTISLVERRIAGLQTDILQYQQDLTSMGHHLRHSRQVLGKPQEAPTTGQRMQEMLTGEKIQSKYTTTIKPSENVQNGTGDNTDGLGDYYSHFNPSHVDLNLCGKNDDGEDIIDIIEYFDDKNPASFACSDVASHSIEKKGSEMSDMFYKSLEERISALNSERAMDKHCADELELERIERSLWESETGPKGAIDDKNVIIIPTNAMMAQTTAKQVSATDFRREMGLISFQDEDESTRNCKTGLIEVVDDNETPVDHKMTPEETITKIKLDNIPIIEHLPQDDKSDAQENEFDRFWDYLAVLEQEKDSTVLSKAAASQPMPTQVEPILQKEPKKTTPVVKDNDKATTALTIIHDTVVPRQRPAKKAMVPKAITVAQDPQITQEPTPLPSSSTTAAGLPEESKLISSTDAYQRYLTAITTNTTSSFFAQYLDDIDEDESDYDENYYDDEDWDDEDLEMMQDLKYDIDDIYGSIPGLISASAGSKKEGQVDPVTGKVRMKFSDMIEEAHKEKGELTTHTGMIGEDDYKNAIDPDDDDDREYMDLMWSHLQQVVDKTEQEEHLNQKNNEEKPVYATYGVGTTYNGGHALVQKSANSTLYTSSLASDAVKQQVADNTNNAKKKANTLTSLPPSAEGGRTLSRFKQKKLGLLNDD